MNAVSLLFNSDWFGFIWFVWCGQPPSSATDSPASANVESKTPVINTVEMNVQG